MQHDYMVKDAKSGIFKYRRRVPERLLPSVGKREVVRSLNTRDLTAALRAYVDVHRETEELFKREERKSDEQIIYEATMADLRDARLIDQDAMTSIKVDPQDGDRSIAFRDAILAVADKMTPQQLDVPPFSKGDKFSRLTRAMIKGVEKPRVRLADAVALYLAEKQTKFNAGDLAKQVRLVQMKLVEIMGEADPALLGMTRKHAQAFRDRLLQDGCTPSTAKRRISTIKAVLNHAHEEIDGLAEWWCREVGGNLKAA